MVGLFAARLRELRVSRGMTQAALAEAAGVAAPYLGRLERGQAAPGIDLADRLAAALGVPLAEMFPPAGPRDAPGLLAAQARRNLEALLRVANPAVLAVVNPLLAMIADSVRRSR